MQRLAIAVILLGCDKGDSKSGAKPEAPSFGDVKGVVVTKSDVLVDGKSLGTLPERLATDRAGLIERIRAVPMPPDKASVALSYTDDAPAPVVLAALRAINEVDQGTTPPPVEDEATRMALDEGKMGKKDSYRRDLGLPISIGTLVGGKRQQVCDARAAMPVAADGERVELSLAIGVKEWRFGLSRVNESQVVESIAKVAENLKQHKMSAFFADRTDVELTAEAGTTGAQLTPVLTAVCAVGFIELRPLTLEEVAAQLGPSPTAGSIPRLSAPNAVPTMSIGQPNAQGDLDKAIIRRYIKRNQQKLTYCYEKQLLAKPTLSGTVSAQFYIQPDGTVSQSVASGVDPDVANCVADVIKEIEFPKPKGGSGVQVNYPFTFRIAATP